MAMSLWSASLSARGALTPALRAVRNMHLHEGYSLDFMRKTGVTVPRFKLAHTAEEAVAAAKWLGTLP